MTASHKIQQAFDRAANSYDEHSLIQQQTGMTLTRLLQNQQPRADSLLDLGCGTGITTQFLASHYQYQTFHAIDIAPRLLTKANLRLKSLGIHVYALDFDQLPDTLTSFDIVFSNMALQWSNHLAATLQRLQDFLQDKGTLAFSLPLSGTLHELQSHCETNFFHEAKDITNILNEQGYLLIAEHTDTHTLNFADTRQALHSIKQMGANHVRQRMHKGLITPSAFRHWDIQTLTWRIGYFIARKR